MFRRSLNAPRKGALALVGACVVCSLSLPVQAAEPVVAPVGKIASNFEQLRVTELADQLIRYLAQAVDWVDKPGVRMPTAAFAPHIRAAVASHPEALLAGEQRESASLATREAFAGYLPQVSANIESGNRHYDQVSTPREIAAPYTDNSKAVALSASQLLYDFGAVSGQVRARSALETAAAARAQAKTSELTLRALTAWLEVFRARQTLAVADMNVLSRKQILTFIEEREKLGGSPQSDVLRVRARLSDAQVALVSAQNRLTVAEALYREAFNQEPPEQLGLPEAAPVVLERYSNLNELMASNAQLAEARAQTQASGYEAKSAAAALLPSLRLDVTARRRDLGAGSSMPGTDWTAGVMVRQNLYSGGSDLARKRQAEQRAKESQLAEDGLKRQLERALAQSLSDVKNSSAAVAARRDAVQVAAVALEAVREQFAFRRGTLLDLLRAQEELYIAGRDLIDGVVDQTLVRYRLLNLSMDLAPLFDASAVPDAPKN